jgi:hypothetical protein
MLVARLDDYAVVAAFFCSVLFIAGASFILPWWRSVTGQSMVMIDVALAVALGPSTLHHFDPGFNIATVTFAWYYFASFVFVCAVILYRLGAIFLVQRRGRAMAARERLADARDAPRP